MRWLLASVVLLLTAPAALAQTPTQEDLLHEVRAVRQEAQSLRRDLNRSRSDAEKTLRERAVTEQHLFQTLTAQEERLRAAQVREAQQTTAIVVLGGVACLALLLALLRRGTAEPSGELLMRRSRIAHLREQVAANEARIAELAHPAAGKQQPSP